MNSEIKMSVSTMTRGKDSKAVYVLFEDGAKSAEFALPECRKVSNNGFSDEEIAQLIDYIQNEQDSIYDVAKKIRESNEFINLNNQPISDVKYVSRLSDISVVYMYLALPLSIMSKLSVKCIP